MSSNILNSSFEFIVKNQFLSSYFKRFEKALLIMHSNHPEHIHGGAILTKQIFTTLRKNIQKNIEKTGLKQEYIWICTIGLHKKNKYISSNSEFCFETFYQTLHQELVKFGLKENISFLYMILEPGEYFCTEALGCWPYIYRLYPLESLDGLYHDILSLTAKSSKAQNSSGYAMFAKEIKLAA